MVCRLEMIACCLMAGTTMAVPHAGRADVVVLENRTRAEVGFSVIFSDGKTQDFALGSNDVQPVPVTEGVVISFDERRPDQRYGLEPGSIYYFETVDDRPELCRLLLEGDLSPRAEPSNGTAPPQTLPGPGPIGIVPVMLLVDDDEPAVRQVWEERLRKRLAAASEIIQRHCRIRFEATRVGTWKSDDTIEDFGESLGEFARSVRPDPALVAIGFTSQYALMSGRYHLGGTGGPLCSHVLIRERGPQFTATERLEVLVHELGHLLGAVHSADPNSVMRPQLSDRRSRAQDFRIHFDPINTLAMYSLGEELRSRQVHGFQDFTPATRQRLRAAYTTMARLLPDDPAAPQYLSLLDSVPAPAKKPPTREESPAGAAGKGPPESLAAAARVVVDAIREAAEENRKLGQLATASGEGPRTVTGDALTELLVRRAAAAAQDLPQDLAVKAYLLGLGIGLDTSKMLRENPLTGGICIQVESEEDRSRRVAVLGKPSMHGRYDLAKHFAVSCALVSVVGAGAAETAGTAKEVRDSHGGSGFSFVDLSANLAGITFATHLTESKLSLAELSTSFNVEDFLPPVDGLPEGIMWDGILGGVGWAFEARFGSQREEILRRILALPGYREQPAR